MSPEYCFRARRDVPALEMAEGDCLHVRPDADEHMCISHHVTITPKDFFNAVMAGDLLADTCTGDDDPINAVRALCTWPWTQPSASGLRLLDEPHQDARGALPVGDAIDVVRMTAAEVLAPPAADPDDPEAVEAEVAVRANTLWTALYARGYTIVGPIVPATVSDEAAPDEAPDLRVS